MTGPNSHSTQQGEAAEPLQLLDGAFRVEADLPAAWLHGDHPTLPLTQREIEFVPESNLVDTALEAGRRLGRYVLLRRIGVGAMGVVYLAHDTELQRQVALKLLRSRPAKGESDSEGRQRLLQEARNIARVHHPNIVMVHDVGELEGRAFVSMEYIEGKSLGQAIADLAKSGKRSSKEIAAIYVQAARGLAAAHTAGLVHRDFKPENAMIDANGRVRVLDFGIAISPNTGDLSQSVTDTWGSSTASGEQSPSGTRNRILGARSPVAGTPAYMAPEVYLTGDADARSDQFAFCVALYEALHGRRPFGRKVSIGFALASGAYEGRKWRPSLRADLPICLRRLLRRGLSLDPAERFESMSDIVSILEAQRTLRRRIYGWAVVGAMTVLGVFSGQAIGGHDDFPQCSNGENDLSEIWNETTSSQLSAALSKINAPYTPKLLPNAQTALETFSGHWKAAHERTCTALRESSSRDADVWERQRLGLRLSCLHSLRGDFAELVTRLSSPSAETSEYAMSAIESLGAVEACASDDAGLIGTRVLSGRSGGEDAERLRTLIRMANAAVRTQNLEQADAQSSQAMILANDIDNLALLGEAELCRARVEFALQNPTLAKKHARLAIQLGEETGQLRQAMEGWMTIAKADIYLARDAIRGMESSDMAYAILRRLSLRGTSYETVLLRDRAAALDHLHHWREAIDTYNKAAELVITTHGEHSLQAAQIWRGFAIARLGSGDVDGSEEACLRSLELVEELLGRGHPEYAKGLASLARIATKRGEPELALQRTTTALEILRSARASDGREAVSYLLNMGAQTTVLERYEESIGYYNQAIAVLSRLGESQAADAAKIHYNLGILHEKRGHSSPALQECMNALKQSSAIYGEEHPISLKARSCVAVQHFNMQSYDQAAKYFGEVLHAAQSLPEDLAPLGDELTADIYDTAFIQTGEGPLADAALAKLQQTEPWKQMRIDVTQLRDKLGLLTPPPP